MKKCKEFLEQIYTDVSDSISGATTWEDEWNKWYPQWEEKREKKRDKRREERGEKKQPENQQEKSNESTATNKKPALVLEEHLLNEHLALLITYGDSIKDMEETERSAPPKKHLATLYKFLDEMCDCAIKGVHILPYFPYTSDDGFSISDYNKVREDLGDWTDIEKISEEYALMSDIVLNHCSSKHEWFQKFLKNEAPYNDYFISSDPDKDYTSVVRPRPHFILSEYETAKGTQHIWTTFSKDQVDLNFSNPKVLFEMLDVMLLYVLDYKSKLIRLDAIAYLWKELGTDCIHHEKTHLVVKLMRALLEHFAPGTIIITETNVPHEENISYFGDEDEAQMVYQFPLPPLLLYSMITENTSYLKAWAGGLPQPTKQMSYFNFCASHDGIGMTPTHGILSEDERNVIVDTVKQRGGLVSYKATATGKIPYELNINYLSAVAPHELPNEERAKIFLASQSILLTMPGVPGIYIHSLLGSENWNHGVKETGQNRTINRQQLDYRKVVNDLSTEGSLRNVIFNGYINMLKSRSKSTAFHPAASMQVLHSSNEIFAIIRDATVVEDIENNNEKMLCIANVSAKEVEVSFEDTLLPWNEGGEDVFTGDITFFSKAKDKSGHTSIVMTIEPYEVIWLKFSI